MTLGGQVVELVGLYLLHNPDQVGGIGQVSVVQHEVAVINVWILVEVVDPAGVEAGAATLDAMDNVAFLQ